MSNNRGTDKDGSTREERLSAKLRENLRRRKEQARAIERSQAGAGEAGALPKQPDGR